MHRVNKIIPLVISWVATAAAAASTGSTGSNAPFSQYQPSLVMSQLFASGGTFPINNDFGPDETLGMIRSFAGNYTAFGAPLAQGQLVNPQTDTPVFSVLGNTFGGDGKTTIALPNLVGRTIIGSGAGPGGTYAVGQAVGNATTVLTEANLPPHSHSLPGGGTTGVVGQGVAFDNHEPSLALTSMIAAAGFFPSGGGSNTHGNHVTLGEVSQFAGNFVPNGWLAADGSLLSVAANQALFDVIGNAYGGNGVTTFALPDLRGRTVVGAGAGRGLATVTLGEQFGTPSTTLTVAEMAAHDHSIPGGLTGLTGGGAPFDTHQPSLGLTYLVSLAGIFPSDGGTGGISDQLPYLGEVMAFAGGFAPGGWALADGQLLSIAGDLPLFDIIGTTYGGDGVTTFALPDLRGRSIIGSGAGFSVGDLVGADTTTLGVANLAAHDHPFPTAASAPEPASWALMLTGFAIVGLSARRRSSQVIVCA